MFVFDGSTSPEMEIACGERSVKRCAAMLAKRSSIGPFSDAECLNISRRGSPGSPWDERMRHMTEEKELRFTTPQCTAPPFLIPLHPSRN